MLSPAQKALIGLLAKRIIRDAMAAKLAAAKASAQNRAIPEPKPAQVPAP